VVVLFFIFLIFLFEGEVGDSHHHPTVFRVDEEKTKQSVSITLAEEIVPAQSPVLDAYQLGAVDEVLKRKNHC
jgi:hypothetical protein